MTAGDAIFLISATAEKPSRSGIITSMMTISNASGVLRNRRTASMPFSASVTSCPSNSAYLRMSRRIFASSSTIRILYMTRPPFNCSAPFTCIITHFCEKAVNAEWKLPCRMRLPAFIPCGNYINIRPCFQVFPRFISFTKKFFYCLLTFREKWSKIFYRKYIQIIRVFSLILECFYNPLSGFIA